MCHKIAYNFVKKSCPGLSIAAEKLMILKWYYSVKSSNTVVAQFLYILRIFIMIIQ